MVDFDLIRKDFPILDGHAKMQGKPVIYLDNSATTLKPKCVLEAIRSFYEDYTANSHRGDYDFSYRVDENLLEARKAVARFINADLEEVIFTSGSTASINEIVIGYAEKNLKKDDEILISEEEHAANILPWFNLSKKIGCKVNFVKLEGKRITPEIVKKSLTKNTKIVSLASCSNVLGYMLDIKGITKVCHENGSIFIMDGAQSVPHCKTDVKDLDVDFLFFSSHKMCGPSGVGVLYGKNKLLEKMDPFMYGGGMNITFTNKGEYELLPSPEKFEAGTLPLEEIFGFKAAIEYLESIGIENIEKREKELKKYAISELKKLDNVDIYNEDSESGIIALNVKGVFAQDLATFFNSRGIAVRSGLHCAKLLPNVINVPATVRASIYFYNTKEDIDAFVDACKHGGDFLDAYL